MEHQSIVHNTVFTYGFFQILQLNYAVVTYANFPSFGLTSEQHETRFFTTICMLLYQGCINK